MDKDYIPLPSLTDAELTDYVISDPKNAVALWKLTYDNHNSPEKMIPYKDSLEAIKSLSITGKNNVNDDGSLTSATKATSKLLLRQAILGNTGITIRLPHSGFSIRLSTLSPDDLFDLETAIAKANIPINRHLSGDIYAAIYYQTISIIISFIMSKIEHTSIKLRNPNDIIKYIRVKDINMILLLLAHMMHPTGFDYAYTCGTRVDNVNEGTSEICGNTSDVAKINITELLYYTIDFTELELAQLLSDAKESISIEAVKAYQESFELNKPESFDITANGTKMTITVADGTLDNYINKSSEWITSRVSDREGVSTDDIESIITAIGTSRIGQYYYAFKSIAMDGFIINSDKMDLEDISILSTNVELVNEIEGNIRIMLDNSAYSLGAPRYVCPSCVRNGTVPTDELITNINPLTLFITLV